jgi:hypothetical protein
MNNHDFYFIAILRGELFEKRAGTLRGIEPRPVDRTAQFGQFDTLNVSRPENMYVIRPSG